MRAILAVFVMVLSCSVVAQEPESDILGKVLAETGLERADIGFQPKGYWNRFPLDVPYRLPSFDDLFAEPFKLYDFSMVMGNVVETYLDPLYVDSADNGLYQLLYHLGVDKRQSGFRNYSANLAGPPESDRPILAALERIYALGGEEIEYRTFGNRYGVGGLSDEIDSLLLQLPDTIRAITAELLVNLADAIKWRKLAFRNCDPEDMQAAFEIRDLAETQGDGQVYYPQLDDLAATIDWPSLHYAALKTAAATEQAERALLPLAKLVPARYELEIETPFGKIAIFSADYKQDQLPHKFFSSIRAPRPGWMSYDATNTLCVIDFGRNAIWNGTPGATASLSNPISVLIDLGGDDYYGYQQELYPPNAGVGLLGVGVVIDTKGDDHYEGSIYAQGAGMLGVGVLLDREGNDHYRAGESSQGAGYFGIGLCADSDGRDEYYLYGDGQGMGGIGGGVGILASVGGDDQYTAEPFSDVYNRGDYHSEHKINGNNAQGAGFGRRGDGSDGHAWAGGLGTLIDIGGNDHYYSGNFSLGIGYWFGTGIVVDRGGNDTYESCYFTQGSGAHYCNGVLIDQEGNDIHKLFETAGAAFGFGWDFTNAFLINIGGDDQYRAKNISYGLAEIRSNAFFIELGGNDRYEFSQDGRGIGGATWRNDYGKPSRLTPYYSYAKSLGTFIDIGGQDEYFSFDDDNKLTPHALAKNNSLWLQPAKTDSTFGDNNYGVGIDTPEGIIPEIEQWEK